MWTTLFFPRKSCCLWGKVAKYCRVGRATDACVMHTGYVRPQTHTHTICNTYCFSTRTVAAWTHHVRACTDFAALFVSGTCGLSMHPFSVAIFLFFCAVMSPICLVPLCNSVLRLVAGCHIVQYVLYRCSPTTCISGPSLLSTYSISFDTCTTQAPPSLFSGNTPAIYVCLWVMLFVKG